MSDIPTINAGEIDADALLKMLKRRGHVVIQTELLGSEHTVTLRWDGETFYCDTPTRLHEHETEQEMRTCVEQQGYIK